MIHDNEENRVLNEILRIINNSQIEILFLILDISSFNLFKSDRFLRICNEKYQSGIIIKFLLSNSIILDKEIKEIFWNNKAENIKFVDLKIANNPLIIISDRSTSLLINSVKEQKSIAYSLYDDKLLVMSYLMWFNLTWDNLLIKQKIEEDNEKLREFINIAAHELRNPIMPIKEYTKMLREFINNDVAKEYINIISQNAIKLHKLSEDILDISKIEKNMISLKLERFDLIEMITSIISQYQTIIKVLYNDSIKIMLDFNDEDIIVEADEIRLTQILQNILNNAVIATYGFGDQIQIILRKNNNNKDLHIAIKDNGRGLDPKDLGEIFNLFVTKNKGGNGLGLYLTKELCIAHHGNIYAENNIDGRGLTFHIILPIIVSESNVIKKTMKRNKILLIHEDGVFSNNLKKILEDKNINTDFYNDHNKAIKDFIKGKYLLVITSLTSKLFSGYDIQQKLRELDREIKVVFLSYGKINYATLLQMFDDELNKNNYFLDKNMSINELIIHINSIIGNP